DPGIERRLTSKSFNRFPGFNKTVLSQIPGVLLAMYHVVNHSKYAGSVASYQLVECLGVAVLAPFDQVEFRYIGLGRSRFRLHFWTDSPANSFNAGVLSAGLSAETPAPLAPIFAHESNNAIADLEEALLDHSILGCANQLFPQQL